MVRFSRLAPVLALLAACAPAAPAGLSDADRAAIQASSDSFAAQLVAGNVEALARLYTADAVMMPPNIPAIVGHDAVKTFIGGFPKVAAFSHVTVRVEGRGDLAYVHGNFRMTFADTAMGGDEGKYIEIRRRQADGSWPMEVDMWSSNKPAPMPAPAPTHTRR